jgi:hypothetical protein
MPTPEWSTLYVKVPTPMYNKMRAAADADDRSLSKWVQLHFREFFEKADQECALNSSSPDTSSESSA